jgi:RNA polymerase sigma factor (sigma-70 family)
MGSSFRTALVNDTELLSAIERLRKEDRDQGAWEDLYRCVYPYLIALMFRAVKGNRYLAEEAVQEVMLRILRNFDFNTNESSPASLMSYVKQTGRSVLIDLMRRETHEGRRLTSLDKDSDIVLDQPDPNSDQARRVLLEDTLAVAMRSLEPRQQTVVSLLLEGRNIGEVAHALSVSEKTAYNIVSMVRKRMRELLFVY